jgi:polysaccharide biosynthesis protein PslH
MRLLSIPIDLPCPANTGGRIDVWRRLRALREGGAEIALLSWYDARREGAPSQAMQSELRSVVTELFYAPITRSGSELAKRLCHLGRLPSHVASRWVSIDRPAVLAWAKAFGPDAVLLDGLYGGQVAMWLAQELQVPLLYRSHNIEHQYMRKQLALQTRFKSRMGLKANLLGLESFERKVMRAAQAVFDISVDDMAWWQQEGFAHVQWLPTSVDMDFARRLASTELKDIDLLYFGNLNTPNNVDAVRWLLHDVMPRVGHLGLRVVIAGSRPSAEVRHWVAETPGVVLVDSPSDMAAVIRRARVLINPVRQSSGVNLKSVEMLFSDAALVSTAAGVQGLPQHVKACFEQGETAQQLAALIQRAVSGPQPELHRRQGVREVFVGHRVLQQLRGYLNPVAARKARVGA